MNTYKPIFNHAAIAAAKKQEQKDKRISAILSAATIALLIARPFILGE